MALELAVYENGDHTFLMWTPPDNKPIANCLGFAIEKTTFANGVQTKCLIPNYVDFGGYASEPLPAGDEWKRPFQRFLWWDYHVTEGQTVAYQVFPVLGDAQGNPRSVDRVNGSALSAQIAVTGQFSRSVSAYFNKGIIAAQWVSKELAEQAKLMKTGTQKDTMTKVLADLGNPLRDALGGLLKKRIVDALKGVKAQGGTIYAALYELNDPELLACLKDLGASANLILANGAFNSSKPDENADVRKTIKSWKTVKLSNRMVSSGHFAHNKFVVFCDASGAPRTVLTGSTNWTKTGLCTQANNAMFIQDDKLAKAYYDQWFRLKSAGNDFPPTLKKSNSTAKSNAVDGMDVNVWFAPTLKQQDMIHARNLIEQAKDGILFLFFNPGKFSDDHEQETLLQTVVETSAAKPNLYVRGVVNQKIAGLTDGDSEAGNNDEKASPHDPGAASSPVMLYGQGKKPVRAPKEVLVPAAIQKNFAGWQHELLSMGVMVHSKVVIVDPFGTKPVVMTGSHNLGAKASRANDDNLVILEGAGARAIAQAYAINIIAIYQEYRWRTYVAQQHTGKLWEGLVHTPDWQAGHLADPQDRLFWMPQAGVGAPPAISTRGNAMRGIKVQPAAPVLPTRQPGSGQQPQPTK